MTWAAPKGGFFIWATLPAGREDTALLARAFERGVAFVIGSAFYVDGTGHDTIRLSFSAHSGSDFIRQTRVGHLVRAENPSLGATRTRRRHYTKHSSGRLRSEPATVTARIPA